MIIENAVSIVYYEKWVPLNNSKLFESRNFQKSCSCYVKIDQLTPTQDYLPFRICNNIIYLVVKKCETFANWLIYYKMLTFIRQKVGLKLVVWNLCSIKWSFSFSCNLELIFKHALVYFKHQVFKFWSSIFHILRFFQFITLVHVNYRSKQKP